jgi:hypothetical protein
MRWTVLAMLLALVVAQFIRRPVLLNPPPGPPMSAHVQVPPVVDSILRRACYDCHSNETRWPLYARVAPASWIIAEDVRAGRSDLNFSDWSTDPGREPTPSQRLGGICSDLRKRIMPIRSYLFLHPSARVSPAETEMICAWTQAARESLRIVLRDGSGLP